MAFLYVGNVRKFRKYSKFKSLEDFNNQIEQWLAVYKHQFTESELIALKRLIRYCAKVYGVSTAKINVLLDAINKMDTNGYGISRSTFKRMLVKARRIGLLETIQLYRDNDSKTSNLYIFHRFTTIEPCRTESEQTESASEQESIVRQLNRPKTNKIIKTNKHKDLVNKEKSVSTINESIEDIANQLDKKYRHLGLDKKNRQEVINEVLSKKDTITNIHNYLNKALRNTFNNALAKLNRNNDQDTTNNIYGMERKNTRTDKLPKWENEADPQAMSQDLDRAKDIKTYFNSIGIL